jgi:hypothetical protein
MVDKHGHCALIIVQPQRRTAELQRVVGNVSEIAWLSDIGEISDIGGSRNVSSDMYVFQFAEFQFGESNST